MKIPLPGGGTFAFLLDAAQAHWVDTWRASLEAELAKVRGVDRFGVVPRLVRSLPAIPVSPVLAEHLAGAADVPITTRWTPVP